MSLVTAEQLLGQALPQFILLEIVKNIYVWIGGAPAGLLHHRWIRFAFSISLPQEVVFTVSSVAGILIVSALGVALGLLIGVAMLSVVLLFMRR